MARRDTWLRWSVAVSMLVSVAVLARPEGRSVTPPLLEDPQRQLEDELRQLQRELDELRQELRRDPVLIAD